MEAFPNAANHVWKLKMELPTVVRAHTIFRRMYPLVNIPKTVENHHFQWENPLFLWSFSIAMLVITRGYEKWRKQRSDLPEENYEHLEDDLSSDTDFSIYPFRPSLVTRGPVIEIHINPPVFDGLPIYVPHMFFIFIDCCPIDFSMLDVSSIFVASLSENRVLPKLQF